MLPHMGSKEHPAPDLEKLFPSFYEYASLGQTDKKQQEDQDSLAKKAAMAMMAFGGGTMPSHIKALLDDPEDSK